MDWPHYSAAGTAHSFPARNSSAWLPVSRRLMLLQVPGSSWCTCRRRRRRRGHVSMGPGGSRSGRSSPLLGCLRRSSGLSWSALSGHRRMIAWTRALRTGRLMKFDHRCINAWILECGWKAEVPSYSSLYSFYSKPPRPSLT